jgi:hypothetical protein
MGSSTSKVECIWLPGQSGKTRKMMERITALESVAEHDRDKYLNILISANNRSLVDQTETRMNNELFLDEEDEQADAKIEGSCFKWHSGLKANNITVGDLADKIKEDEVTMVVCCAHAKRLVYICQLLTNLEKSKNFKKKINIWIDEADASIKLWSKPELDVTGLVKVEKVTLVSATYDSILKKFGQIRVLPCLETTLPMYHRVQDCIIIAEDIAADSASDYLERVIKRHRADLVKPGVCLFAPGDIERVTHEEIAKFLSSEGFSVVIINGVRKEIIIPGRTKPISLEPYVDIETGAPEEIGKIIAKIYHDNDLHEMPFAITGHLCIGRGITFQNDQFLFTHGILFDIPNKADAYQTACRLAGNIKNYESYAPSTLFTTSKMMEVVCQKENTAIGIARHIAEEGITHVDMEMIKCLYGGKKSPVRDDDFLAEWKEFSTLAEAKAKGYGDDFAKKKKDDGFYYSSFTGSAKKLPYDEITRAKAGKKTANMPTDMEVGGVRQRFYVGYRNPEDSSSAVFVVRSLMRVNESPF